MPMTPITSTPAAENNSKIPPLMNSFQLFRLEKQNEIVARCPGANYRDISKVIAKWWKELPEEEKERYRERARIAKIEHAKMYPIYKSSPQRKGDMNNADSKL
ncbi:hypothetical protein O0I10_003463 [Lichtheimia ornata]|uniref:HMG box domain-containing protein n=1 Tax=Lichtheimia ornata TaxID=688661 RepID=A0AAD7V8F4_9FUNG|nr:uncharacterized protein O0I10_003463 [Lichtheimia ornata]KAJ8660820.1 hypothetical protein O0I10_003463 [Lichtheimia ornata]